ncbi:MAG: Flp family type IVb pilin [Actinomycetia bacterium]|nr:Flp family type IVb pilin [Actinomycetes bacterium]
MIYLATNVYVRASSALRSRCSNENGASMVEYALLMAFIAITLIVATTFIGTELRSEYSDIGTSVANAGN